MSGGFIPEDEADAIILEETSELENDLNLPPDFKDDILVGTLCEGCQQLTDFELPFKRYFNIDLCRACTYKPEYKLIPRSEAKKLYLLTDEELKDTTVLPSMPKPNPHKSHWKEMHLYLVKNLEKFAKSKWNASKEDTDDIDVGKIEEEEEDGLEMEKKRRKQVRSERTSKVFTEKLAELRKKTQLIDDAKTVKKDPLKRLPSFRSAPHVHDMVPQDELDGVQRSKCSICGIIEESEEL